MEARTEDTPNVEEQDMEIDNSHLEELSKLETVRQKDNQASMEVDFDKIKVSDLAAKG